MPSQDIHRCSTLRHAAMDAPHARRCRRIRRFRRASLLAVLLGGVLAPLAQAATFVVDKTNAGGNCTAAPGDCGLDAAVLLATNNVGADVIEFNIPPNDPGCDAAGVCVIAINNTAQGGLVLTGGVTMDGYTQPGAAVNTLPIGQGTNAQLKIVLRGPGNSVTSVGAVVLRGLVFQLPVVISAPFPGPDSGAKIIAGNFFGIEADGVNPPTPGPSSNLLTVVSQATGVRIGSGDPADMNLLSTIPASGSNVECLRLDAVGAVVRGNLIGTRRDGLQALACTNGINITNGSGIEIGGDQPGQGNVIGGTVSTALAIVGINSGLTARIRGNRFGVGVDGTTPLPNVTEPANVSLSLIRGNNGATHVQIGGTGPGEGNVFAFTGVSRPTFPSTPPFRSTPVISFPGRWAVLGNRFIGNDGTPFLLQGGTIHSPNDPGDADSTAQNSVQNFPEITAATVNGNQLQLIYRVDTATSNANYPLTVEFHRARDANAETLLGRDTYTAAEAQSLKSITLTLPAGVNFSADDVVIANATDTAPGAPAAPTGQSSEFSFHPLALTLDAPLPSSCGGNPHVFCDGFDTGPQRSLEARVRATSAVFKPNGRVHIRDSRGARCTAELQPSSTPLTSVGSCILVGSGAPGSITIIADSDARRSAFASASGGDASVNGTFVIAGE